MLGKRKINIDEPMKDNHQNEENLPIEEPGAEVKDVFTSEEEEKPKKKNDGSQSDSEKAAELNDKYLRLHADFENFRRRTNKEKTELILYGNQDLLLKILPVYDDFER